MRKLEDASGRTLEQVTAFCTSKRITVQALVELGTRLHRHHNKGVCLAYAGDNGNGTVTAIKFRPINGSSHDSWAEEPSTWLRPIVIGNLASRTWLVAEGETDAARLCGLVGDRCAILVLPLGAKTFWPEWADLIPRGAITALCHDADKDGDLGAETAATVIGTRVLRIRPPIEDGDWCDWDGTAEEFLKLATPRPRFEFVTLTEFKGREMPEAKPLLGQDGKTYINAGSLTISYGPDGSGKSTLVLDGAVHLAAGAPWLGIPVPGAVRVLLIENEGPAGLFQAKVDAKVQAWVDGGGKDPTGQLFVLAGPWGRFAFSDPGARLELAAYCDQNEIELVVANPTLGLGAAATGRPDETAQFVEFLRECGLWRDRAFWLVHHENKSGQISGDWGRHPDTYALLQRDGNRQRSKLTWAKTRWATLDPDERVVTLEWITESWSYSVIKTESAGVSDAELDARITAFLIEHPYSPTVKVKEGVEGSKRRIEARLGADDSPFDAVPGPRNSLRWFVRCQ